ncbi:MAG TPA: hypothetical protein PLO56_02610 [Rhodothermales bacterium]|nr:hypothetical protein [Rhodothermales bacterium]
MKKTFLLLAFSFSTSFCLAQQNFALKTDTPILIPNPEILEAQMSHGKMEVKLKDPDTGLIFSILLPGGGHLYSGETKKGLLILGSAILLPVVGTTISAARCTSTLYGYDSLSGCSFGAAALGYIAAIGAWGYGIYDAKASVHRTNALRMKGLKVSSVMPTRLFLPSGRTSYGASIRFQF